MEHLLSMGFSEELSAQALAATGGASAVEATEWILSHQQEVAAPSVSSMPPPAAAAAASPTPPPHQRSPPVQPSLDRFFPSAAPQRQQGQKTRSAPAHRSPPSSPPPPPLDGSKRQRRRTAGGALEPLAERMRPRTVDEVVGQDHLLGQGSVIRSALDRGRLPSLLLWGPPGAGKTSIARALAASPSSAFRFVSLSAVTASVKDVRDATEEARRRLKVRAASLGSAPTRTVLFMDEVHRFSKAQQDAFLPAIEDGSIVFVGATTENPSFHLTTPLLSRCRVLTLRPLEPRHVETLLRRAVEDAERGIAAGVGVGGGGGGGGGDGDTTRKSTPPILAEDDAVEFLSLHCDGDARVALNALEVAATLALDRNSTRPADEGLKITLSDATEAMQSKHLAYDRAGEEHYNLISALHKSMRGGDADASIYWLARMLEGGEQPLYIARRLVRFAGEDVGLADPAAVAQAVACYQACHFIGMPECDVNLAQCVAYLALAPKSTAVYRAIQAAQRLVKESAGGNEGVPLHLRNAPTKMMKDLGYGKGYVYPPDHPNCSSQTYLPPSLLGHKFLEWPPPRYQSDSCLQ
ncbi:unnamed protein product [Spirodela intermedia]|uniref:UBA domain-containing protein n=1 Tax=Spirodela intermedia TaxID=51605 RepID=A0A7I8LGI7_SPIIN|nr:unnamed protein product [Spirodela intermedia]